MATQMTARKLIQDSMRTINVLASGETPTADEAADCLSILNEMVEAWALETLMLYHTPQFVFSITPGQQVFTIGPGGDFDMPYRPIEIDRLYYRQQEGAPNELDLPIIILTPDEFRGIRTKRTTSTIPTWAYVDYDYPLVTIQFWPIVREGDKKVVVYPLATLQQISDLDTLISMPEGYARALRFNLAVEISPEFSRPVTGDVATMAADSLKKIKRRNQRGEVLAVDSFLLHHPVAFDYRTGEGVGRASRRL